MILFPPLGCELLPDQHTRPPLEKCPSADEQVKPDYSFTARSSTAICRDTESFVDEEQPFEKEKGGLWEENSPQVLFQGQKNGKGLWARVPRGSGSLRSHQAKCLPAPPGPLAYIPLISHLLPALLMPLHFTSYLTSSSHLHQLPQCRQIALLRPRLRRSRTTVLPSGQPEPGFLFLPEASRGGPGTGSRACRVPD